MNYPEDSFKSAIIHHEETVENGCFDTGATSGPAIRGRVVHHQAQTSPFPFFHLIGLDAKNRDLLKVFGFIGIISPDWN